MLKRILSTPLQNLNHHIFYQQNIQVWLKRDDLNHPLIQGNKLHKLQYNLIKARELRCDTLISFGGAYSNHISALSVTGKEQAFKTIGFIRGDELANEPNKWSHTLLEAQKNGMGFIFLSRQEYRQKHIPKFLLKLQEQYPTAYIIPEGGTNLLAVKGFKATATTLEQQCPNWTHLFTAVGTGGTLAGLSQYSPADKRLFGVATLKNSNYLKEEIKKLTTNNNWQLLTQYHGDGYAKSNSAINATQKWFETEFKILLDPIYTNKMVYAFMQELQQGKIKANSKVILYHSGGLQGRLLLRSL
jgi:1-aminocyclopropane-1-carboxylate deaminase